MNYQQYSPKTLCKKALMWKLSCEWKAVVLSEAIAFLLAGGRPAILLLCIWWKLDVIFTVWHYECYIFFDNIQDFINEVLAFFNGLGSGLLIGVFIGLYLAKRAKQAQ